MDIGYCRVSTQGQTLESQIEQLQTAGCSKIHSEKASGIRSDRAELRGLVNPLMHLPNYGDQESYQT